jgi:hypothetical protein
MAFGAKAVYLHGAASRCSHDSSHAQSIYTTFNTLPRHERTMDRFHCNEARYVPALRASWIDSAEKRTVPYHMVLCQPRTSNQFKSPVQLLLTAASAVPK